MKRWITLSLLCGAAGCTQAGSSGGWFAPQGEPWTILCLELQGAGCQATARQIAQVLRGTDGIDARKVRLEVQGDQARIYYGTYYRRTNPATRQRSIPRQMRADLRLLKELTDGQGARYFLYARKVPAPSPDVGDPQWDLRQAKGVYTLQVAVYFNDDQLHNRKLAAVEKVRQLRDKGLEAYYYHGQVRSIVTVGIFGEDAVLDEQGRVRRIKAGDEGAQVVAHHFSAEVIELRKHPDCTYNLTNDGIWYNLDSNGARVPVRSMLVRIPIEEPQW